MFPPEPVSKFNSFAIVPGPQKVSPLGLVLSDGTGATRELVVQC